MWLLAVFLLGQLAVSRGSITFPNASEPNELLRTHEYYQPSPLVDSIASLGIHTVNILFSSSNSNTIISPLNIFQCLDILHLGAAGDTKEEIDQIVGHSQNEAALSHIFNTLNGTTHASAVFFSQEIVTKTKFVRESYDKHQTEVLSLNFSDASEVVSAVNGWVSQKTNGRIPEILQQSVDSSTKVVVVTALVFTGQWLHPFSPSVTELGRFDVDDENFINVPVMHLEAYIPVIMRTNYNAVGLPYKGGNLIMYVILPHRHGLQELKNVLYSFSPTDLKNFPQQSVSQTTFLQLPKFKIDCRVSLKNPLIRHGMRTTFDPVLGNFTDFSENEVQQLYVSDILHSVQLEVNEHETAASAASAAIFTKSRAFEFKATRPFVLAIADDSGLLLFLGVVVRPA